MPELPEVETITTALKPQIIGKKFTKIEIFFPKLRYPLTIQQNPELLNQKIVDVRRRARYTIIELDNLHALILHYGMTGAVRIVPLQEERLKHEHVFFHISNNLTLRFEDARRFGFIQDVKLPAPGTDPIELAHLGPEPFDNLFTGKYLHQKLKGKKTAIKTAIMKNEIVVGVGNIYANEALFASKIDPQRESHTLTTSDCTKMVKFIKKILTKAIAAGGSTIADFKGVDGSEGKFSQELQVYGRQGQPCHACHSTNIERIVIGGRSTFYCPHCQN